MARKVGGACDLGRKLAGRSEVQLGAVLKVLLETVVDPYRGQRVALAPMQDPPLGHRPMGTSEGRGCAWWAARTVDIVAEAQG